MPTEHNPEEIRQRMNALRGSLDLDVEQVATSVRAKTDWRYYVRNYPWLTIAAATAVGYLVVPRRVERVEKIISDPDTLARLAKQEKLVVSKKARAQAGSDSIMSKLLAVALAAGSRAAIGYVSGKLGSTLSGSNARKQEGRTQQTSAQPSEL